MNCVCINRVRRSVCGIIPALLLGVALITLLPGCGEEKKRDDSRTVEYTDRDCSLEVTVSAASISIAENLRIELRAEAPVGWDIVFTPAVKEFKGFVLTGEPEHNRVHDSSGKEVKQVMTLLYEPQLSGEFEIPAYGVKFVKGKDEIELKSEPLPVTVRSQISDIRTANLKDIPGVLALQKDYFYWYVTGGVLLLVLVVAVIVMLIIVLRRRARYRAICRPFFTALKNLQKLEKSGNIEQMQDDMVWVQVSDILRVYIEERFEIAALKCTTEEFLNRISGEDLLLSKYSGLLREFLEKCDIVKFAKYTASAQECHNVINSCRVFVLRTKRDEINYKGEYGGVPGAGTVEENDKCR